MALLYGTGFDAHGAGTADLTADGWTNISGGNQAAVTWGINVTSGRGSGGAFVINNGSSNGTEGAQRLFPNTGAGLAHTFIGTALFVPGSGNVWSIFALRDNGTQQVDLRLSVDGSLSVTRNGTSLGSTSAGFVSTNSFHYFEGDFVIGSGTNGSATIKMDGTTVISVSGVNTQATANGYWNQLVLATTSLTALPYAWDDMYVCDGTDTSLNSNLGDVRIAGQVPTGQGIYSALTKVGAAATHWQSVNQKPNDGDTTYLVSANAGDIDTFTFPNLPANTIGVVGVVARPMARKDDAGAKSIGVYMRSGSSGLEADGPGTVTLPTGYAYQLFSMPINPTTGLPWTIADVNAMEFGIKVGT